MGRKKPSSMAASLRTLLPTQLRAGTQQEVQSANYSVPSTVVFKVEPWTKKMSSSLQEILNLVWGQISHWKCKRDVQF